MTDIITRDLHLPVSIEEAWAAVTDPQRLADWLADEVELVLIPGGSAEFVIDGERREGWVEEICPPGERRTGRLAFWWQAGEQPASRVEFTLTSTRTGTHLRVRETRPLDVLDLVGVPLGGGGRPGGATHGPALVAAGAR